MNLKKLFSTALGAAAIAASSTSSALPLQEFLVSPGALEGLIAPFQADKITGNYTEVITFGANTFSMSLLWNAGQFVADDGTKPLAAAESGLGAKYNMWATFMGAGTFESSGATINLNMSPGGALNLWLDPFSNGGAITKFTTAADGSSAFGIVGTTGADDITLATGAGLSGNSHFDCAIGSNNCGSFGQTNSIALTAAGRQFFVAPVPFYQLALESGQFNSFTLSGTPTLTLNGSLDVVFVAAVPEPHSYVLMSAGLLAVGWLARRRRLPR